MVEAVEPRTLLTGTWVPLANLTPGKDNVNAMLLLTDGTVMAEASDIQTWYALKPDPSQGYVGGTWKTLCPMKNTRLDFASAVLPDGNVFVAGGETGSGGSTAETYDPVAGTWHLDAPQTESEIADAPSKLLTGDTILLAPREVSNPDASGPAKIQPTLLYNPVTDAWTVGQTFYEDANAKIYRSANETSWVLLRDGSILTVDNDLNATTIGYVSERYLPSTGKWMNDGVLPNDLWYTSPAGNHDTGPGVLLDDGRAFFLGASGETAIYTPAADPTQPGTWKSGPRMPSGLGAFDTPAVVLPNGNVLCATGPMTGDPGVTFLEYDPATDLFTPVANSPTFDLKAFGTRFLALPDGTALYSDSTDHLFVYKPDGVPLASARPTITNIQAMPGGSFHLIGTQLNGLTEGAYYGDDAQMSTNYPIVELTDAAHNVFYAKTTNWSIGLATGNQPVSTDFTLPAGLSPGNYSLSVVANGVASSPFAFSYGPSIVNAAAAMSSTVTGETTVLSALGTDQAAASSLTYTWTVSFSPPGAPPPTFTTNGSANADVTTATFHHAGTYVFLVTMKDDLGLSATNQVGVLVAQSLTSIAVSPASATIRPGATLKLSASALDQFGEPLASQPSFTWHVFRHGRVNSSGRFTAAKIHTIATVKASSGSVTGSATISTIARRRQSTAASMHDSRHR